MDKDDVPMGTSSVSKVFQFESEILLTFEGDFENDQENIELTNFELLYFPSEIDFGEITPDAWGKKQSTYHYQPNSF